MVEKENRRIIVEQAIDLGLIPISAIIPPYAVGLLRIVLKLWYYYHSKEKPQSEENEFLERLADEKLNRIKHISTVTYQYVFDKIHSDDEGHYNDYSSEEYLDALYKTHKFLIDKALEDEANKKDEV